MRCSRGWATEKATVTQSIAQTMQINPHFYLAPHIHTHTHTNTHTHTQIHTGTNTHTHTHITINRPDNANKRPNPINRLPGRLIATDRALSHGTHAKESRHGTHVNESTSHGTHWYVHQSRPEGD